MVMVWAPADTEPTISLTTLCVVLCIARGCSLCVPGRMDASYNTCILAAEGLRALVHRRQQRTACFVLSITRYHIQVTSTSLDNNSSATPQIVNGGMIAMHAAMGRPRLASKLRGRCTQTLCLERHHVQAGFRVQGATAIRQATPGCDVDTAVENYNNSSVHTRIGIDTTCDGHEVECCCIVPCVGYTDALLS